MNWYFVLLLPSLLFVVWVWWGITFTILIWFAKETDMTMELLKDIAHSPVRRDRIIRYSHFSTPGLLSVFDAERNIQHINKDEVDRLPQVMRNRLEMCTYPATQIVDDKFGLRFAELA